jgi:hypothetical protein
MSKKNASRAAGSGTPNRRMSIVGHQRAEQCTVTCEVLTARQANTIVNYWIDVIVPATVVSARPAPGCTDRVPLLASAPRRVTSEYWRGEPQALTLKVGARYHSDSLEYCNAMRRNQF